MEYNIDDDKNFKLIELQHYEAMDFVMDLNILCLPDYNNEYDMAKYRTSIIFPSSGDFCKHGKRVHHHAHDVGYCPRRIYYTWFPDVMQIKRGRIDASFLEMGHRFQAQLMSELNFAGFIEHTSLVLHGIMPKPGIRCEADGMIRDPEMFFDMYDASEEKGINKEELPIVPIEVKAVKNWSMKYREKAPSTNNYDQLLMYMHLTDCQYGFMVYINRDTMERMWYKCLYDEDRYNFLSAKLDYVYHHVTTKQIPPNMYTKSNWHCKICPYIMECWSNGKGLPGRTNVRKNKVVEPFLGMTDEQLKQI